MPPYSNRSATAVAEAPADFDPNVPVDPAAVMGGNPIGVAAEDELRSPSEVRSLVKSMTDEKTVDPTKRFERPADPRLGSNARERLSKAVGTAVALRDLQAKAEAERLAAEGESQRLMAERDAELDRITREFGERIAAARQSGRASLDAVTTMRSARDQVLANCPDWLRKQRQARECAIVQAHHEGTTCLQSEVERKRNFIHPPSNRSRSYACASAAYASYVQSNFSEGHQFLPPGGKRDQNIVMRHLEHLHTQWAAELPELEKQLADNLAAKQRDVDAAEDEAIAVAVESL